MSENRLMNISSIRVAAFALVLVVAAGCQQDENPSDAAAGDERMAFVRSLFSGVEQYEQFNRLREVFPHHVIRASTSPYVFPRGETMSLPSTYIHRGASKDTQSFLEETDTAALFVVSNGAVVYENYWLTGGADVHWMSMSVGKSFVSALVGIALEEGLIQSVEDPVTDYVPSLGGSAYEGVRIKDLLQMSSGARWNEDYSDPQSDIMRFIHTFGTGASLNEFTSTLVRAREPGTHNYYNSMDTQALGMLLVAATGESLSAYAQKELWEPLGMEQDGFWITDDEGMEMAAGGLQVVARDYAKLGQLYLDGGSWRGTQIIPAGWVQDSVRPDGSHVQPGLDPAYPLGYGYQWWIPPGDEGEYSAIGVYNQFIYVNPTKRLVIVKLSANSDYGLTDDDSSWRELETFGLFRSIGNALEPL
jgi:CubicO group peptidase (beta-lactamase class C family)